MSITLSCTKMWLLARVCSETLAEAEVHGLSGCKRSNERTCVLAFSLPESPTAALKSEPVSEEMSEDY